MNLQRQIRKPQSKPRKPVRGRALGKAKRPITMAAPGEVKAVEGRPHPLTDPSNSGDWGQVDKTGLFAALTKIRQIANPKAGEFIKCEPLNLAVVIDMTADGIEKAQGKTSSADGWDEAFANAPSFRGSPEPTSENIEMKLKARGFSNAEKRAARGLLGRRPICMALPTAEDSQPQAGDDWGDIDNESTLEELFKAINRLIALADPDGKVGEFPVCRPGDLATKLSEAADKLTPAADAGKDAPPVTMRLKPKPGRSRGFTEADRAAARRLRGMK
jgi:hypothetical protein